MITLRPYQGKGVADIRTAYGQGCRAILYVLQTGGGKTVLFSYIAHGAAAKQRRVYILSHRIELIDQISAALTAADTRHSFIANGYGYVPDWCMVCSVPSLLRRLDAVAEPNLIIIDEAHHSAAETWSAILTKWPRAKLLGVTATPQRPDGRGLGKLYKQMILGPSTAELIRGGYLASPRVFAPPTVDTSGLHTRMGEYVVSEAEQLVNRPSITGSALEHYQEHTNGLPALAFCVSVKHSEDVAADFRKAGYSAIHLSGKTDRELRRAAVKDYRAQRIQLLSSCDLFSEGFDVPGTRVGIMLNPTQSIVRHRQQTGRIMRPGDDKWIFDHVGNTMRFGLPDDEVEWTLEDEDKKKKKKPPSTKVCEKCFSAARAGVMICKECGHPFPTKPREVETRAGKLAELTREEVAKHMAKRAAAREQSSADLNGLIAIGKRKGMKNPEGWAAHVVAARLAKRSREG